MNMRGQSALEYLMTYGWALIVIAIVIGVLIFVTSGSTGGVTCQSLNSQMQLTEWSASPGTAGLGMTLRNATSGPVTTAADDCTPVDSGVGETVPADGQCGITGDLGDGAGGNTSGLVINPDAGSVGVGNTWTVSGIDVPAAGSGQFSGTVTVAYQTQGGLDGTVTITCNGTV